MDFGLPITNWRGYIREVHLGPDPTCDQRKKSVTIGGATSFPFHDFEGSQPHPPLIAWEIPDNLPTNWVTPLPAEFEEYGNDTEAWVKKAEQEGAPLICLTLTSTNPDNRSYDINQTIQRIQSLVDHVSVPIILRGVGSPEHQGTVLSTIAEALDGRNCVLASAVDENYKTIVAAAMAFDHTIVAESPIDVNLAKQLNILITDMNFPTEKILIDPLTGGLGYGLEYTYSVMERIRLQALNGDPMMQMPFICFVGDEAWKVKEVRVTEDERPDWGDQSKRAILWEVATAMPLLLAGADILVMRHPAAIQTLHRTISSLYSK